MNGYRIALALNIPTQYRFIRDCNKTTMANLTCVYEPSCNRIILDVYTLIRINQ